MHQHQQTLTQIKLGVMTKFSLKKMENNKNLNGKKQNP